MGWAEAIRIAELEKELKEHRLHRLISFSGYSYSGYSDFIVPGFSGYRYSGYSGYSIEATENDKDRNQTE